MRLSYRAFPHPVVGNGDDVIDAAFQAPIEVRNDTVNYFLRVEIQCSSRTINKLVERGEAAYTLHVECGNTFYRQAFEFSENAKEFMIPGENLNATVEVNVVARAKTDIKNYRVENAHEDYGNSRFNVSAGEILAVAEGYSFDADINFDALKSISSIMCVRERNETEDGPLEVDLLPEKITIYLSKGDFERYKIIRSHPVISASLVATIVLPALVEALSRMKDDDHSDIEGTRWCRCLKRRLENLGLSLESEEPLQLAQKILEFPVRRAFMSACSLLENDE